jgi:hypothetical protein
MAGWSAAPAVKATLVRHARLVVLVGLDRGGIWESDQASPSYSPRITLAM